MVERLLSFWAPADFQGLCWFQRVYLVLVFFNLKEFIIPTTIVFKKRCIKWKPIILLAKTHQTCRFLPYSITPPFLFALSLSLSFSLSGHEAMFAFDLSLCLTYIHILTEQSIMSHVNGETAKFFSNKKTSSLFSLEIYGQCT